MKILFSVLLAFFAATVSAQGQVATPQNPFPNYAEKSKGWHFKEIIPDDIEPQPEPVHPPPVAPKAPAEPEGPKPLSSEWIRANMPKYLDAAVDNPTPQNVANYMYLQKYAMDASTRFAEVTKRVVANDPILDENNNRPTWGPAAAAMDLRAQKATDGVLKDLSKKAGLWFFFRSDCEPCHLQAPILEALGRVYGIDILSISVDGQPIPSGTPGKFVVDRGNAQMMGVQSTPTVFLAKPPNTFIKISEAPLTFEEMKSRLVEVAAQMNLISEEKYQTTVNNNNKLFPSQALAQAQPQKKEVANDPNAMREYLRSLITSRK